MKTLVYSFVALLFLSSSWTHAVDVSGTVVDESGNPLSGVMISAIDETAAKSVSVFSSVDGRFKIDGLDVQPYRIRARTIGKEDGFLEDVNPSSKEAHGLNIKMRPVEDNLSRSFGLSGGRGRSRYSAMLA